MAKLENVANPKAEKIKHAEELYKNISDLFLNEEFSDVTLIVESKSFHCHKLILASRSEYFKALLYGNLKEARESEIELKEVSSVAFHSLLTYIYTSEMDLTNFSVDLIFDIFHLAHQFSFESLLKSLSTYLTSIVNISNVCLIFEKALLYEQAPLIDVCGKFIDDNANKLMKKDSFLKLHMSSLETILRRDSFIVEEIIIFRAVQRWIEHAEKIKIEHIEKTSHKYEEMLKLIRLPLISSEDLLNVVRPTNLVSDSAILDAMSAQSPAKSKKLKYRGYLIIDENLATSKHGSTVKLYIDGYDNGLPRFREYNEMPNVNWVLAAEDTRPNYLQKNNQQQNPYYKVMINLGKPTNYFTKLEMSNGGNKWFPVDNLQKYTATPTYPGWFMMYFPATVAKNFRVSLNETGTTYSYLDVVQCLYHVKKTE